MDAQLRHAIATDIKEPIDLDLVNHLLASPPFITIPGLFNTRDLSDGTQPAIKQNYLFRSGSLENLSNDSKQLITNLGITTIFDLRARRERVTHPEPDIPGVIMKWEPSTWDNDSTATHQAATTSHFSFAAMYLDLCETHKASFRPVFAHIRDYPDRPFLFHCTAGKDRTGIMSALILGVAGVPIEYIDREYALSRIGIEPVREFLVGKLLASGKDVDLESPEMQAHAQIPLNLWTVVSSKMSDRYGSVERYVKNELGFNDAELQVIRENLKA